MVHGIVPTATSIDVAGLWPGVAADDAVDLRLGSPNFAHWYDTTLSAKNAHH